MLPHDCTMLSLLKQKTRMYEKKIHIEINSQRFTSKFSLKRSYTAELITLRFAGWISSIIVSLQPVTNMQKLISCGNQLRISETLFSVFREFTLLQKVANCTLI